MNNQDWRDLENTRQKLDWLEYQLRLLSVKPATNPVTRELTKKSLKKSLTKTLKHFEANKTVSHGRQRLQSWNCSIISNG